MTFSSFLNEAKDQLDISILSAQKYLTTDKKKEEFLSTPCKIEAKTDGVKVTIIKVDETGDYSKDYIFAYKGNVLYIPEFDYVSSTRTKKESVGASQFKLIFDHFSKLPKNNIPVGTELFIEYLMRKSTLSSNYDRPHGMVLIAHSHSKYEVKFGKLKTEPSNFDTSKREEYAKVLKLNTPLFIFKGILGYEKSFEKGIKNEQLKARFASERTSINWNDYDSIIIGLSHMLLSVESAFGGTEEGCVLIFPNLTLKFQQEYQVDQTARAKIKLNYRDTPENEEIYWKNVKLAAFDLVRHVVIKSRKLEDILKDLAVNLKNYKLSFEHSKKTETNIKDDIQLTAKTMIIKDMKGNNNALFFGKYRILTSAHYNIIKRGLSLYDDVVVALVTGADTENSKKLREKMLHLAFPGAEIIHSSNGNIVQLLQKSPKNINVVIAGTDRVQSYRKQLEKSDIVVKEIPRISNDISASKVIQNIEDFEFFKANTPKQIHRMYQELLKFYKV